MTERAWGDAAFLNGSRYRRLAARALEQGPQPPSSIAQEAGVPPSHVSRALKQMETRGLATCLSPSERVHYYELSARGREAVKLGVTDAA